MLYPSFPIFSLIIPHYNAPQLLKRLLSTLPFRSDLEIIVVDDCSTKDLDELEIVKSTFPKVLFYSTGKNGGGGKARNIGLSKASGQYVFFADADDYFTPGIEAVLNFCCANDKGYDIVFFDAQSVDTVTYSPSFRANQLNRFIKEYKLDPKKAQLSLRFIFGEPWCKIIRKEIIDNNEIKFEELPVHNDTYFSYMIGYYAKSIGVCPIVAYCVTESSTSVSKKLISSKLAIRVEVFAKKNRFFIDKGIKVFDEMLLRPFDITVKKEKGVTKSLLKIAADYDLYPSYLYSKLFFSYLKRLMNRLR